jgi:uncharacterized membrane protein YkvA (DUF1232 family)
MNNQSNDKNMTTQNNNLLESTILNIKLITRLMGDQRVSWFLKLLPIGSLAYLVAPLDFIPGGMVTLIGAADDAAVMWFGLKLFLDLCPADVVDEHIAQITGVSPVRDEEDVVEAEVVDLDD